MYVKYNKGYDLYIIWDGINLPLIYFKGKELKPYLKRSNTHLQYPIVNVPNHGENYVHILVAFCFLNKEDKDKLAADGSRVVVDHINGNTMDYRPSNLQYLKHVDNIAKGGGFQNNLKKF